MLFYAIVKVLLSMLFIMHSKKLKIGGNPQCGLNENRKRTKKTKGTTGYCYSTSLRFRPYLQWPIQGKGLPTPPPFGDRLPRSPYLRVRMAAPSPPLPLIWRSGPATLPCRSLIKYPATLLAAQGPISDKISWHSVSADKANEWAANDRPFPRTS